MSRQDTFVGLSPAALKLVKGCGKPHLTGETEKVEVVMNQSIGHSCRYSIYEEFPITETCVKVEEGLFKALGIYDREYPLSKYTFRDGRSLQEIEQVNFWSSGPVIFTCLADVHGHFLIDSQWTKEEMEQYVGELIEV